MSAARFRSASGLRPMSAFVTIACVLLVVGARVAERVATYEGGDPRPTLSDVGSTLGFSIEDAAGRRMATFVERYELRVSPRAMWQAHTPDHMARAIARVTGGVVPVDVLLERMLPPAPFTERTPGPDGRADFLVTCAGPEIAPDTARRVALFLHERELDRDGVGAMHLVESPRVPGAWRIAWRPVELLSKAARETLAGDGVGPWTWTRALADGLADALWGELDDQQLDGREEHVFDRRDRVWEALMPSTHRLLLYDVPVDRLLALRTLLTAEGVLQHQMWLDASRERVHPGGEHDLLGTWGWLGDGDGAPVARSGLERLCQRWLEDPIWSALRAEPGAYERLDHRSARRTARPYFQSATEPTAPPVVRLSLDLELQEALRARLADTLLEYDAAVAMGIVVDVESAQVLAVDAADRYGFGTFPPIHDGFTPGSTFKPITMAIALDLGLVDPDEELDVGHHAYHVPGSRRVVGEAHTAPTGIITAAECVALSSNAGMVQIGLRVPGGEFHRRLELLGYGRRPDVGLGHEAAGYFAPLPWVASQTHASISFGHEVLVTLWQHAAGLAAIARGGEWKPLRLVAGVGQDGAFHPAPETRSVHVFRRETCRVVRAMMELGAREGTGKTVYRPGLSMATKTGTTHKKDTELCTHVHGAALAAARERDVDFDRRAYDRLPRGGTHGSCYTSSMAMLARPPAGGRELLVLVVVEEPRRQGKFGSRVAGPAALAVMLRALGVQDGPGGPVAVEQDSSKSAPDGFGASRVALRNRAARPWADDVAPAPYANPGRQMR